MKLKLLESNIADKTSDGGVGAYTHSIGLFVDEETGVEYFVMNSTNAGAICPRYDKDGKIYIHK